MSVERIGILGHGFVTWEGGVDFLRLVIGSLLAYADQRSLPLKVHLLLPVDDKRLKQLHLTPLVTRWMDALKGREEELPAPPPHLGFDKVRAALDEFWPRLHPYRIGHSAEAIEASARKLRLKAVIPAMAPLPNNTPVNWVGYIYDMQHIHFPHFFSSEELQRRDDDFQRMLSHERAVIVNSRSVRADIHQHVQTVRSHVIPLPFGACPHPAWLEMDQIHRTRVRDQYDVGANYFCICNQFWKHKDHATAIRAFAEVATDHPELELVCTGHHVDYRDPSYFGQLVSLINDLGLTSRIKLPGSIPKLDQIALLQGARALIQPTLFEGGPGGGALFDAVSLGVPSIVSDIPVNKEVEEPSITYFSAGNPSSLAAAMRVALASPMSRELDSAALLKQGNLRRQQCGAALFTAINHGSLAR